VSVSVSVSVSMSVTADQVPQYCALRVVSHSTPSALRIVFAKNKLHFISCARRVTALDTHTTHLNALTHIPHTSMHFFVTPLVNALGCVVCVCVCSWCVCVCVDIFV